ncbi:hypothetical protein OAP63_03705 [Vibrio sp.]|nr:hypothetical protein [Vibrio sp.]
MGNSWSDIFPWAAGAFKLIILGIGGYLAIRWHFDEEARVREEEGVAFDRAKNIRKMVILLVMLLLLIALTVYLTNLFY